MAVMGEMKGAKIDRLQQQRGAANSGQRIVESAVAEGRAMDRLVQGCEEEAEDDTVHEERGRN